MISLEFGKLTFNLIFLDLFLSIKYINKSDKSNEIIGK